MKIGIDCRMLGPEQGGLGRYIEQLVYHLSLIGHDNEYVLFLTSANWDKVKIVDGNFKFKKVLADIPWYGWKEQLLFPQLIKKERLDIMHFPHWNVPMMISGYFVVTIHDLLLLHYPTREASTLGPIGYWFKNVMYRFVLRHAVSSAQHILTTSEFTKRDIHQTLSVPLEKMTTAYQAPTPSFLPLKGGESSGDVLSPPIRKPYILYVGVAYPHKNLDRLIEAWKIVQEKTDQQYQLVLAGKKNYFYDRLEERVKQQGITDVVFTGFVPDEDLSNLYREAKLYVFPSLYEGFGLPPLEAWTHNLPVVASNRTCLPEVLGEAALYFDPESIEQIADAIVLGLSNEDVRSELRQAAREELKRFSWQKLAEKTLQIYQKVLSLSSL